MKVGQEVWPTNAEENSEEEASAKRAGVEQEVEKSAMAETEEKEVEEEAEQSDESPHSEGLESESPRERDIEETDVSHHEESQLVFPVADDLAFLTGLKTRPDLEGQLAIILKWHAADERYAIHVLSDPDLESVIRVRMGSLMRLKANL